MGKSRVVWIAVLAGFTIAALAAGKAWFDRLPRPVEVTFEVTAPGRTRIEDPDAKPDPVVVRFSSSVAPLASAGKTVQSGIQLRPSLAGTWTWTNDQTLDFRPADDWPVDAAFAVELSTDGLIAEQVRLRNYGFTFRTAPFVATLADARFDQDPVDPASKKVVATVRFSHPLDITDFAKHVALQEEGKSGGFFGFGAENTKFSVSFDKLRLNAYVHSEALPIPARPLLMNLTIDSGLRSAHGGRPTAAPLKRAVRVPGLYSLTIESTELTSVDNERLEPERILMVSVSADTPEREVAQKVRAWMLPLEHPGIKADIKDERKEPYPWSDPVVIGPEILRLSNALKLTPVPAERESVTRHAFKLSADAGRYLYIRVGKGIKSFGGYLLEHEYDYIMRVEPFPRQLRIASQGALLALSGEKKLPVFARDVESVRYQMGRLMPQQLQHLVTMSAGTFDKPDFYYGFDESNITEPFTQFEALPPAPAGRPHYLALDLARYLEPEGGPRRGVFYVKVESYDAETKSVTGAMDRRLVVVTDLGLVVKRAIDGTQDMFVQSIATGQPVTGAVVDVISRNGAVVATQTTNASGQVRIPDLSGFARERQPVVYLVRKDGDSSFLPFDRWDRQLNFSRFDIGGVRSSADAGKLSAYLFSDRRVYRPGEEIRVGMIVKAADWTRSLDGLPLEVELTDARGLALRNDKIRLSRSGFEELRHTTLDSAQAGDYIVALYIVKDGERASQLGAVTVKVQEFIPDRLKMGARLSQETAEGWVQPQGLKARVNLQNLFGTPAESRLVTARLTLTPAFPSFPSWRDYQFYDPQYAKEGYEEPLADGKTDENGNAEFDLNLGRFARATYRLHVGTQGFEADGGRGVSAETATLVSDMPYLVGYKADGDLNYVSRGGTRTVELIAIDARVKKTAARNLRLLRIERRFVSVLTKQYDGTYRYESREKLITLDDQPFELPERGRRLVLPTNTPGSYSYIVRDGQGQDLARIPYDVAGRANLTRSLEKNAELQIKLNKKDFNPGEEIELSIRAPYAGAGLITIERERVHAHAWFKTTTTSSTQSIRLPEDFEGNGYVSVTFVRDLASDEIYASPLAYGVQPFAVNLDRRRLKVDMRLPDLVKPGDTIRFRCSTDRPARMVVFAVDEGILQVARYRTADPLAFFFQKRALEVRTLQILDLILPEFRRFMANAAPGGDAEGELGKYLNPFKRKRDKPAAYWSGIIDSGPRECSLTWRVPDSFNGTLRVMAVAVSGDAIGVFEKKVVSRGDFVLSPNAPLSVSPGDEFDVSVGVANNVVGSGTGAEITVSLATTPQLEIAGPASVKVRAAELRESVTSFRLRAKELGSGTLTVTAALGNRNAKLETDTSVRPPRPRMVQLSAGTLRNGRVETPVTRNLYSDYRKLEAGISFLPLALAHGLVSYLDSFPYSCTEQLLSMGVPALVLGDRPEFGYVKSKDRRSLEELIAVLRARQNDQGAFGLWAANAHVVNDYASAYAMHFLVEARERGRAVPGDMFTRGNDWLRGIAASDAVTLSDERTRAYAIYILTRQGVVTTNFAAALQKRLEANHAKTYSQDIAAAYLAATYRMMKQQALAERLIVEIRFGAGQGFETYHDSMTRNAELLFLLARHFPERLPALKPETLESLVVQPIVDGHYNTYSSAQAILALDAYARAVEKLPQGNLGASEVLRNGTTRALALRGGIMPRSSFTPDAAKLEFTNKAQLNAYWFIEESGFDIGLPDKEIRDGLEMLREYLDASGKPVQSVKVGDEIQVRLKFRAIDRDRIDNVALVDLLPGGFDLVRNRQTRSTWTAEFADFREDRVVLYGAVRNTFQEFVYRIRATNTGTFAVPPAYGESMYERGVRARSMGSKIVVEKR